MPGVRDVGRQALPTEAEWELAARGGLEGDLHVGRRPKPRLANYWHGDFPWRPNRATEDDAGRLLPPNEYGLYDMAGNAWDWTAGTQMSISGRDKPCCVPQGPRGASIDESYDSAQPQFPIPRKVIKGGSFGCADSYCMRYRPAARRPQMIDTGMSHIGFRCVIRAA
jgi:formylglycine-generating enzyme required for sulfatase activity